MSSDRRSILKGLAAAAVTSLAAPAMAADGLPAQRPERRPPSPPTMPIGRR
ncbi:Cysteine desulfurase EC 2817 CDS [Bradyrhizobium sp.]|nr:Cysteine desulfurase EC 2817 CDS [Bradyrhizobium sp.]